MSKLTAKSPVFFLLNGIGDQVLAVPTVRALQRVFGDSLTIVCPAGGPFTFISEFASLTCITVQCTRSAEGWEFDARKVASLLANCDLFIAPVCWYSQSLQELLELLPRCVTVGFFEAFEIVIPQPLLVHQIDLVFSVVCNVAGDVRLMDCVYPPRYTLYPGNTALQLRDLCSRGTRWLAVHADTEPHKMATNTLFRDILSDFLAQHPRFMIISVGSVDVIGSLGGNDDRVVPAHGLPLPSSCALVSQVDLFLGVDSCMLHVADLANIPSVGLFGPTFPEEFGTRFSLGTSIRGEGSLDSIPAHTVVDSLTSLIQ